jgi:predicted RecB family nuclease
MKRAKDELLALRGIGPAMRADLSQLGIETVTALARSDPEEMYRRLERLTGARQDPCVWDVFEAAVHQARTGEARPWWEFSALRKARAKGKRGG